MTTLYILKGLLIVVLVSGSVSGLLTMYHLFAMAFSRSPESKGERPMLSVGFNVVFFPAYLTERGQMHRRCLFWSIGGFLASWGLLMFTDQMARLVGTVAH
jgi:hypothetical protein